MSGNLVMKYQASSTYRTVISMNSLGQREQLYRVLETEKYFHLYALIIPNNLRLLRYLRSLYFRYHNISEFFQIFLFHYCNCLKKTTKQPPFFLKEENVRD